MNHGGKSRDLQAVIPSDLTVRTFTNRSDGPHLPIMRGHHPMVSPRSRGPFQRHGSAGNRQLHVERVTLSFGGVPASPHLHLGAIPMERKRTTDT